jgi:hypothetical protein
VGPRGNLDRCGKSPHHRDSIPGPSSPKKFATPTELYRSTEQFTNMQTQIHQARFEAQTYVMGYPRQWVSEKMRAQDKQVPHGSQSCEANVAHSA